MTGYLEEEMRQITFEDTLSTLKQRTENFDLIFAPNYKLKSYS